MISSIMHFMMGGIVAVLAAIALVSTAAPAGATPLCGPDMRWSGNVGEVVAQLGPTGYIQWGAQDFTDNAGLWQAWALVGTRTVDYKIQDYQPHGRVNPKHLRSGHVFRLMVLHTKLDGSKSVSRPDAACIIP